MISVLPFLLLDSQARLPTRAHPEDAGLDLYSLESLVLPAHQGRLVKTGLALELPSGYVGLLADRSSLGKKGLKIMGGVIDAGYRGELLVSLWNLASADFQLTQGDKIAQLLVFPIAVPVPQQVWELSPSDRGEKGFGSSGR